MSAIEITSLGTALPKESVNFGKERRYRITGTETQLSLLVESAKKALEAANLTIDDIDVIVGAVAVGLQPIPCTAALVHEQLKPSKNIPAFDINSTCTSFITALDIISNQLEIGRYQRALIVSGDTPSIALNKNERHSFELFGDGAVSAVIQRSEASQILYANQLTLSAGAHLTEIVGGLTTLPSYDFRSDIQEKYQFHMEGRKILKMAVGLVEEGISDLEKAGFPVAEIDMVVPHQASKALGLIMQHIGVPKDKYINLVDEYGNMVSASIPFSLAKAVETGSIKRGDKVLLIGTAAGLTLNALLIKY
ncbi:3-oxoacyl-[acyl-carrier-protein] synthase III C-terminal domain-containing protein [Lactovum odontotermitis]